MTSSLSALLEKLERQKAAVLSGISAWPVERLQFKPNTGAWSTLDVIDHLVKTESSFVRTVNKNVTSGRRVGLKDSVGAWLVTSMMRSPVRVKVPAGATAVMPGRAPDLSVMVPRWDKVRMEMADLSGRLPAEQLKFGLFRHPVSGWMTMEQALSFLSAHLRHHEYQLARLRRGSGV